MAMTELNNPFIVLHVI